MRRKDTTKLLKEWKSFLYENKNPKFKNSVGDKVIITYNCPDECSKWLKDKGIADKTEGEISVSDLRNIKIGNKIYNPCLVKLANGKEKYVPDVCVLLKDDNSKEK